MQKRGNIFVIILVLILGILLGYNYSNYKLTIELEESYDSLGWQLLYSEKRISN